MLEKGYLRLGRGPGFSLGLHWSIPLGGLVLTWFRASVAAWLGFVIVLAVHMLGHAALVVGCGARLSRCDVHGLGGHCHVVGLSAKKRMLVAAGGVLAQLALLSIVVASRSGNESAFMTELYEMCVGPSLLLAGLNVLPISPLDGASIWQLPRTVADLLDDDPESFDDKPRRENAAPPKRDWFARARALADRARAKQHSDALDRQDVDEPELSKEAEEEVERLLKKVKEP